MATSSDTSDWSDEAVAQTRYIIQRIIVPIVVIVGIAGNSLTVIVLTRRRMRCTTNIYLTALAIADIVNLFFAFILSLQRYPNYNYGHGIYWSTIGISHWLHDASLYTSIYLTVSFTLERYISVCHPLRGQVLCTESRAKKVITVVVILCFLCTITTRFEYDLKSTAAYFDHSLGALCTEAQVKDKTFGSSCKETHMYSVSKSNFSRSDGYQNFFYYPSIMFGTLLPFILLTALNGFLIWTVRKSHQMRHTMTNTRQNTSQENKITITLIAVVILFLVCQTPNALQMLRIMSFDHNRNRDLVLNNIFNLLIAINAASNFILYCLLSDKYRKTVKVLFCGARPKRHGTYSSSSRFASARATSSSYIRTHNSNFFDVPKREHRFSISKDEYAHLQAETSKRARFSISSAASQSRTNSIVEADLKEVNPIGSPNEIVSKSDKNRLKSARFTFASANRNNKKQLRRDVVPLPIVIKPDDSSAIETTALDALLVSKSNPANNNHIHVHKSDAFLRPSPSETSLTRSRSLILPSKAKHSPDCKDNPYKF